MNAEGEWVEGTPEIAPDETSAPDDPGFRGMLVLVLSLIFGFNPHWLARRFGIRNDPA